MRKKFNKLAIISMAILGLGVCTFSDANAAEVATSASPQCRMAVVDVAAVVNKSAQVQALKKENEKQLQELQKWLELVKADVTKQQTKEGQEKLLKKYNAEFAKKKETLKANYDKKLKEIDKSISQTISEQAKANNYNMVFAKGNVLYGGDDITSIIIKNVK